jgi:hypothetical protein
MTATEIRIAGQHFLLNFVPNWPKLMTKALARAHAIGLEVSESRMEIQPMFDGLTFSGTRWEGLSAGDLRYDVFGYRKDLGGSVATAIGVTSKHPTYTFGLRSGSHAPQGAFASEAAAAYWLRNGALTLRPWSDERVALAEETLVSFDLWQCIDAMMRFAKGERAFGNPAEAITGPQIAGTYASPSWASTMRVRAHIENATTYASFSCAEMIISGYVTLMIGIDGLLSS